MSGPYERAILLLDEHLGSNKRKLLLAARKHLESAIKLHPRHAPSHAALGYTYDQLGGSTEQALSCMREARRLKPGEKIYDVYVPTLLVEMDYEEEAQAEIRAVARRQKVNLAAATRAFKKAFGKQPQAADHLYNSFIRARNFFRSFITDEAERIRNKLEPGRARREAAAERAACEEHQKALARRFDASRVPRPIRGLAPWASRYGVGDDVCRPFLLKRLRKAQRTKLIRDVDAHADDIHAWLDSFAEGQMSNEAAAFMYLAEGVEEIR